MRAAVDLETGALILTVDGSADLGALVESLREGAPKDLDPAPGPALPITGPVDRLVLRPVAEGSLLVKIAGGEATIEGDREAFAVWADELDELQACNDLAEPGMHAHFDLAETPRRRLEMSAESVEVIVAGPKSAR